ncbi:MAG: hypothetical protein UMV23_05450 [Halanaerobium sp.]|nr:hypothetical protein [Halanaerobium sp.]
MKKLFVFLLALTFIFSSFSASAASFEKTIPVKDYWDIPKDDILARSKEDGWQTFYVAYKQEFGYEFDDINSLSGIIIPYLPSVYWMEKQSEEALQQKEKGWADGEYQAKQQTFADNMLIQLLVGSTHRSNITTDNLQFIYRDSLGNEIAVPQEKIATNITSDPPNFTFYKNSMLIRIPYLEKDLARMEWFSIQIISNNGDEPINFKWYFQESTK